MSEKYNFENGIVYCGNVPIGKVVNWELKQEKEMERKKLIVLQDKDGKFEVLGLTGIRFVDISVNSDNYARLQLETVDFEIHNKEEYEKLRKLQEIL